MQLDAAGTGYERTAASVVPADATAIAGRKEPRLRIASRLATGAPIRQAASPDGLGAKALFVGLDIGTTAVKAILIDDAQTVLASASAEHPTDRPAPGWCEQSPDNWIAACRAALAALRRHAPKPYAAVRAIGLSGQMHSAVLLGDDDRPLQPALLWNDERGGAECTELATALPTIAQVTGVQPMAGFTAAKLLWMRKNRPDVFRRIAHIILPKDYVRLWLTGALGSDVSDAAGTQMLDEAARAWWPAAIAAVGLSPTTLPPLGESTEPAGSLRREIAHDLGLDPNVVVATGGGDAGAGALGLGCIEPGQGFISLGTAAVFVVAADCYAPKPETMLHNFAHALPGRWYQMAGMLNGASPLGWWLALLGISDTEAALAEVARNYHRPAPTLFLPYLAGERTPHNNPQARGAFVGLSATTSRSQLVQAILEGIAFSLRDARNCLIAADSDCPSPGFTGGGARSRLWGQIIANVTGLRLRRFRGGELGPALGAARLATIAAGHATVEAACRTPEIAETIEPDATFAEAYAARFAEYQALYTAIEGSRRSAATMSDHRSGRT